VRRAQARLRALRGLIAARALGFAVADIAGRASLGGAVRDDPGVAKKRKRSKGEDPAAEVIRPLVLVNPVDHGSDPEPRRDTSTLTGTPAAMVQRLPGPLGGRAGAHLCYGDPVGVGERAVIPVADVRMLGGWGRGDRGAEAGEGGGGLLGARPIGYIEVSADGSRYVALGSARRRGSALATGLAALAGGVLAVLALRRSRG